MSDAIRDPIEPRTEHTLFGILNPYGQFWTHETFTTPEKARDYIETFWARNANKPDTSKFEVIPVILTISAVTPELRLVASHLSAEKGEG